MHRFIRGLIAAYAPLSRRWMLVEGNRGTASTRVPRDKAARCDQGENWETNWVMTFERSSEEEGTA
ncbi:MAG: hypothetical protein ACREP1_05270 [Rhodanobacteraceae bacterium]